MCNNRVVGYDESAVILHIHLRNLDGTPYKGLTHGSTDLVIAVIRVGQSDTTFYKSASSKIQSITTLGTYDAPDSGKCRFKEISPDYMPGWYELQFENSLFQLTGVPRSISGCVSGPADLQAEPFSIQMRPQPADLHRVNGTANASAVLELKQVKITGSNAGAPSLLIENTSSSSASEGVRINTTYGSGVHVTGNEVGGPIVVVKNAASGVQSAAVKLISLEGSALDLEAGQASGAAVSILNSSTTANSDGIKITTTAGAGLKISGASAGPIVTIQNTSTASGAEGVKLTTNAGPVLNITGNLAGQSVVTISNTSTTTNSHAVKVSATKGSTVVLDSVNNDYAGLAFANNAAAAMTGGKLAMPASNVTRASWTFADWIAITTRYVTNKMVISKTAASMTLYDDGNAAWKMQAVTDDGNLQTRDALP